MADKIILIAVLICLAMFGLRGVLPDIMQSKSLSFIADLLLVVAAVVLVGVAIYKAGTTISSHSKLKKSS